jgi:hypothetical protein
MYVLDTNVISELRKVSSGKANAGVAAWARDVPGHAMFLSVISLHELEHGVLLLERKDVAQGRLLREWLERSVVAAFDGRFLEVTADIVRLAATFHVPDPAPFRDALIAATAATHGFAVVTRDASDFERFGVEIVNPWT